ncbi:helix-turn-helix domain-containing protein [Streptomyces sp. 549]|uniref:TetR/AcrR family transcriptional regulator n=1 Tax=Streptomyces sp. 549 TaxID=3049076 RepID=UPI0024C3A8DB|nr:helix-turn-helix domain-containing protein [Streptomyces sp. 549]MDK1472340.1 helix-turn-helix domain-containing protein [Streptomyces sp. 549]
MRDRQAERRSESKIEILQAAWEVAGAEGLGGMTLRDVARKVGMQPPSLYSYYDSKSALYDAMFEQGCREFMAARGQVPLTGEPLADLKAVIRFFIDFCTENPTRYQLLYQRPIPGFEPSPESYAIAVEGLAALRAQLADVGISDPGALDLLTALSTGLADQQISNDPGGDRWTRLADEAVEMFYAHQTRSRKGE